MGANQSKKQLKKTDEGYLLEGIYATKSSGIDYTPNVLEYKKSQYQNIHNPGFYGEWSRFLPRYESPQQRYAHFTAYDDENHILYIGYGIGKSNKLLNDVWGLYLNNLAWYKVPILDIPLVKKPKQYKFSNTLARSNSSACFYDGKIFVFGGFIAPNYTNNLHMIDVKTGKVTHIETTGEKPLPMSSCILSAYAGKLILWGGYDRTYHTDLYILNLQTLTWTKIQTNVHGRTILPYTVFGKDLYSYGGSVNGTLLHIDLQQEIIEELSVFGAPPPNDAQGTNITSSNDYLFWLGGRSSFDYDYLFMMRKKTNRWSVLHLRPDNESVFVDDGKLDSLNLFAMPHMEGFSIQYNSQRRCIVATLGKPMREREFINVYDISEAMAFIHMRDDMCDALRDCMDLDIFE